MNHMTNLSRRHFLIGTASVGGGLAIGVVATNRRGASRLRKPAALGRACRARRVHALACDIPRWDHHRSGVPAGNRQRCHDADGHDHQ